MKRKIKKDMFYLKLFKNHNQYEDYDTSLSMQFPNVSHCLDENHVHYSKNVNRLRVTYQFDDDQESYLWCGMGASSSKANLGNEFIQRLWINGEEVSHEDIVNLDDNYANANMTGTVIAEYEFYESTTQYYYDELLEKGLWLKTIPGGFFYGCTEIVDVIIPDSIEAIGNGAFGNCSSLSSITIPETIKYVANDAFDGYNSLTPENGILYSNGVAYKVTDLNLGSYEIKEGTKIIVNSLFDMWHKQHNITSITIPNSVTTIGDGAFNGCTGLTSLDVPDSVATIGYGALNTCTSLTSLTIGSGVKLMGLPISCPNLEIIVISEDNKTYDSRDNCNAIIKSKTNTLIYGTKSTVIPNSVTSIGVGAFSRCSGLSSITIPNSVTSIGNSAFSSCSGLTSVTIPNSVKNIGKWAFYGCKSLSTVTIPDSVTSIGTGTFENCSGLTNVTIGNGVTSIDSNAFEGCTNLTSVTIGSGVTIIYDYVFYNCSKLKNITSLAMTAPEIQNGTFYLICGYGTLTVPIGSTGYNVWMSTGNYYLGKYNWTKVEQ